MCIFVLTIFMQVFALFYIEVYAFKINSEIYESVQHIW